MTVVEFDHGIDLTAVKADGYERGAGVHASDLYGSLYKSLLPERYDKRDADGNPTPFDHLRMALGTALELAIQQWLSTLLLGERPPECTADHHALCPHRDSPVVSGVACWCGAGIIYSPDQLFYADKRVVLGELKLTWMSPKGLLDDEKFGKYLTQIQLYLYWLGLNVCRLFIYFVNGNPDRSPLLWARELIFTDRELEEEYGVVMRHARKKGLVPSA